MLKKLLIFVLALAVVGARAQKFTASYLNLEQMVAGIDLAPGNINPGGPAPSSFTDEIWNGGTTVSVSGPAYAAGLSKRAVALPAGVSQFTVSYQTRASQASARYSQANETDLMIVDGAGTLYNGSTRLDNQEGGEWQITNARGAWVDTGFKPGLFPADTWVQVSVVYQANWSASTLSVVSIAQGGQVFSIPAALASVETMANSGWQKNLLDVQLQETLVVAGSYTRDMKNINIACQ